MYTSVKVAAMSLMPTKWDKAGNADKMEAFFRQAARAKPKLIVTTEGMLEGYVVMKVIAQPELAERMLALAEPVDGPYIQRFRRLARTLKTCLAFGFAERIGRDAYNCAIFIDHLGEIRGKYHKTQLAEGVHPTWHFNRIGTQIRAFDTPLGRAGFMICNDRWNPLIARALVLDGAQMLLIPSYGSKKHAQNVAVTARARENGVPVVNANVGMNLIVSKGERVAYAWGVDRITLGVIDVPARPSPAAARAAEGAYVKYQGPEMKRRYLRTMEKVRAGEYDDIPGPPSA